MVRKISSKGDDVLLSLNNVWKIYQMGEVEVPALRGVSLDIRKGDFVAIIGSSGSGKSTIMNIIGCLDVPSKGTVILDGYNISEYNESELAQLRGMTIGFIFQQYNLIPSMSALENVMLPLELQEINDDITHEKALQKLSLVCLDDKVHHRPSQLSGGQQQRVSIARCLAAEPEIILADEPTGALDSKTGKDVLEILKYLWKEEGKTVIMVTHDLKLAKLANTIVELKDGQIMKISNNIGKR